MTQEIEQRLAEKDSTRHQSNDSTIFIVRLREPDKCPTCRFFSLATVDFENGDKESMIHCKRRDCDNWDRENIPEKAPIAFREWS